MMLEKVTFKNNDEYLKQLEEDIEGMPVEVLDRQLR